MSCIPGKNRMRCMSSTGRLDRRWAIGRTGAGRGALAMEIRSNPWGRGPFFAGRAQ